MLVSWIEFFPKSKSGSVDVSVNFVFDFETIISYDPILIWNYYLNEKDFLSANFVD